MVTIETAQLVAGIYYILNSESEDSGHLIFRHEDRLAVRGSVFGLLFG